MYEMQNEIVSGGAGATDILPLEQHAFHALLWPSYRGRVHLACSCSIIHKKGFRI